MPSTSPASTPSSQSKYSDGTALRANSPLFLIAFFSVIVFGWALMCMRRRVRFGETSSQVVMAKLPMLWDMKTIFAGGRRDVQVEMPGKWEDIMPISVVVQRKDVDGQACRPEEGNLALDLILRRVLRAKRGRAVSFDRSRIHPSKIASDPDLSKKHSRDTSLSPKNPIERIQVAVAIAMPSHPSTHRHSRGIDDEGTCPQCMGRSVQYTLGLYESSGVTY